MADDTNLIDRVDALYRRINFFPESEFREGRVYLKPDAYAAFLDLRQLWENEVRMALYRK